MPASQAKRPMAAQRSVSGRMREKLILTGLETLLPTAILKLTGPSYAPDGSWPR